MTPRAFICDAQRTPFGRHGGALSPARIDELCTMGVGVAQGIAVVLERVR